MNAQRRKDIQEAIGLLESARLIIETAKDEEEAYFENMPEGLQLSERGEKADEAISHLDEATDSIDTIFELLESASE